VWAREASNRITREGLLPFIDRELAALERDARVTRVLNVGAGGTLGGRAARLQRAEVITIDDDPARHPNQVASVTALPFADASFDAALMFEVLEHVTDPAAAVGELYRVLKPSGVLLLSTPWSLEIHDAPGDYYRFTEHGLHHLLAAFAHVEVHTRGGYVHAALAPWVRLHRSPHGFDRLVGYAALALVSGARPALHALDKRVRWSALTTGYLVKAER
jgi:SAM-dependent methyltransferase